MMIYFKKKKLKLYNMIIVVTFAFHEGMKYHPELFLDEYLNVCINAQIRYVRNMLGQMCSQCPLGPPIPPPPKISFLSDYPIFYPKFFLVKGNIFVYKLFSSLNISDFRLIVYVKTATPLKNVAPFPQQPHCH